MKKMLMMCALALTAMGAFAKDTYCVIDLSGGTSAASYPVTYLDAVPSGGWSYEYMTTKLVLRKIPAGTFTMGSPKDELGRINGETQHQVTLTKDYYIGVFPVTQRQWKLVMGDRPSYFTNSDYYAPRPVEQVSYDMIRGSSAGAGWPNSSDVDKASFLGVLRAKSGLTIDLPTEAQWEYACRAYTTTALNSGKNLTSVYQDAEMDKVGRYYYNGGSGGESFPGCDWDKGTAKVGSYAPNDWGLYDMHGNVWEWCLDWWDSYSGDATDPKGPSSGSHRMMRGGCWNRYTDACRSATRGANSPSIVSSGIGFRLSCPNEKPEGGPYKETVDGVEWTFMVDANLNACVGTGSSSGTAIPSSTTGTIAIPLELGGRTVTSIGGYAFQACKTLTNVTIPKSVTRIGAGSFWGCSGLTSVIIPPDVTSIGWQAFAGCDGLTTMSIPASVVIIDDHAFAFCHGLKAINVDTENNIYSSQDGVLFDKERTMLIKYPCGKQGAYTAPSSVRIIERGAFSSCDGLIGVTIPSSVTNILYDAFRGSDNLNAVDFEGAPPTGVEDAGIKQDAAIKYNGQHFDAWERVIEQCGWTNTAPYNPSGEAYPDGGLYAEMADGVRWLFMVRNGEASLGIGSTYSGRPTISQETTGDIVIPNSLGGRKVTDVSCVAFSGCSNLTSVTMSSIVTNVEACAFNGCSSLQIIDVASGNAYLTTLDGVLFDKPMKNLIAFPGGLSGEYVIPSGVTNVHSCAFFSCQGLSKMTLPLSVSSVGFWAIANCTNLVAVDFECAPPSGVEDIDINRDAAIRYNIAYKAEWETVVEACGWMNAKPYDPRPRAIATAYVAKRGSEVPESFPEITEYGEATSAYVGVMLESPNTSGGDLYAYLKLKNETQKDLVSGKCIITDGAASKGIRIRANESLEYARAGISLLDGVRDGTCLQFEVVLCITQPYDASKVYSGYNTSSLMQVLVDNVRPLVNNISMSGWNLEETGRKFEGPALVGCDEFFTFDIGDAARDLKAIGDERFTLTYQVKGCSPKYTRSVTYRGNPADLVVTNAFHNVGTATLFVTLLDKDSGKTGPLSFSIDVGLAPEGGPWLTIIDCTEWFFIVTNGEATITDASRDLKGDLVIPASFGGRPLVCVGEKAFNRCNGMSSATIPMGVLGIEDGAFCDCSAMTNVVLSSELADIGDLAFLRCQSLSRITIPSSVTHIGSGAFDDCSALNAIDFEGAPPEGVANAGIKQDASIRYHFEYAEQWGPIVLACGWTNAKPYKPHSPEPPAISPASGTMFKKSLIVSMTCEAEGVTIRYTTDGSEPTHESAVYENPFTIYDDAIIKAVAFSADGSFSMTAVAEYAIYQCETPVITPATETFETVSREISLACGTGNAVIYYTIDGSDPSVTNGRRYKGPFDIYESVTVKTIAVKQDWKDSEVASATFTKGNPIGPAINLLEMLPDNDKAYPWSVVTDITHDGVSAVKSGAISDDELTTLKVAIYGAGQLSFWWRTSCEPCIEGEYYDYATFYNGTTVVTNLAGVTDWQKVTLDVPGAGKHTFKWTYQKDGSASTVPDGVWLDQVQWLPRTTDYYADHTLTTEAPVNYRWLRSYGLSIEDDFETAAKAKTGKIDGAGRILTVEDDFVAGTDPTNLTSRFTTSISIEGGVPKVIWDPDLGVLREYKVWGRESLMSGDWQYPTNSTHHFFKVTVEMK